MKFARWIYLIAGVLGLISLLPVMFAERVMEVGRPEFFYGFVCLNGCWQILYLIVASDPVRYRLMMIPAFLAKATAFVALGLLYLLGRVAVQWVAIGVVDGAFAVLFLFAFIVVGRERRG